MTLDTLSSPKIAPARTFTIYCHLDIVDYHEQTKAISCITGWIVAETGYRISGLGLHDKDQNVLRCNYPFYREDVKSLITLVGSEALTGFNILLPEKLCFDCKQLRLTALVSRGEESSFSIEFEVNLKTGETQRVVVSQEMAEPQNDGLVDLNPADIGTLLEKRLFDHLARQRHLTLRLDLINKCNLRCVMCHYSDEGISKRPAQKISLEQFASFFDPIAPVTRDVVLSCGDEPLMSPHFEAILQHISTIDPEVRIRFCTNGMLLTEKNADAIIAANVYLIMFSFDGVTSETLHRIRVGSNYRRIIKNILYLKKAKAKTGKPNPRFVFNYVMLESNIHEAPHFVRMAKRLGGDYIDFRHVVPFDFYDIDHEMLENDKPKYNYYRERIIVAAKAAGIEIYIPPSFATSIRHDPSGDPVSKLDEFHTLLLELGDNPLETTTSGATTTASTEKNHIHESAHFFCDRPFSEVMVREQKDVYPCPWHQEKMGTLEDGASFEEIFFGDKFRQLRLAMLSPEGAPGCKNCPIKSNHLPTSLLS